MEKYSVNDIDNFIGYRLGLGDKIYDFGKATAYDPEENILYYFLDNDYTVYAYQCQQANLP